MSDNAKTWIKIAIPITLVIIGLVIGYYLWRPKEIPTTPEIDYVEKQEKRISDVIDSMSKLEKERDTVYLEKLRIIRDKSDANAEKLKENLLKGIDSMRYWNNILLINELGKEEWGRN